MNLTSIALLLIILGIPSLCAVLFPQSLWQLEEQVASSINRRAVKSANYESRLRLIGLLGLVVTIGLSVWMWTIYSSQTTVQNQTNLMDSLSFNFLDSKLTLTNTGTQELSVKLVGCESPVGIGEKVTSEPAAFVSKIKPVDIQANLKPEASSEVNIEFLNGITNKDLSSISCKQIELTSTDGTRIAKESTTPGLRIVSFAVN